ncbi:MAG: hypothetical protein HY805_03685 [Nitrospirae bacterium]|nr:hypothetical protein [Nitrospirota bacterium]
MSFPKRLLVLGFFTAFCLSFIGPIQEGDLFYHLRQGEAIWQSKSLPQGFSTQWLGQVIIFLIWKLFGFSGISLMRVSVYMSILIFLFFWMRRKGLSTLECIFFLLFPAHMFISFPSERPQIFSFLFFPITIYLLELLRQNPRSRAVWMLLPIVFLWANIHAGFVIGLAVVWIYFISQGVSCLRGNVPFRAVIPTGVIALSFAISIVLVPERATFIPDMISSFIRPAPYMKGIHEYLSPLTAAINLKEYYPSYWILLLIAAYTIFRGIRHMSLEHTVLIALMAILPFKGIRFMPFFTMLAPLIAFNLSQKERLKESKPFVFGFGVLLALWLAFVPFKFQLGIGKEFPQNAVGFLKEVKPHGKVFNYHGWAGYLEWSLPEVEIFIPVSNIPEDIDRAYSSIIWAEETSDKIGWQSLLDAYGVGVLVIPGMSPVSGEIYSLMDAIQGNKHWYLIYSDETANVLIRDIPQNHDIIRGYFRPKANIYLQIIAQAKRYLKEKGDKAVLWRTIGDADMRLGDVKGAMEAYRNAK